MARKPLPTYIDLVRISINNPSYIMKKVYGHLEFEFGVESVYELDRVDVVVTDTVTQKHRHRIMTQITTLLEIAKVVHGYMEELPESDRVDISVILKDIITFITDFEDKNNDIN